MVKIAVLGAGVNGLTCAVKVKEKFRDLDVVVISSDFTPNTTGDGSGGLWYPYLYGNTPEYLITKWGGETYRFLHKLWLNDTCDIRFMPFIQLSSTKNEIHKPEWMNFVYGYQRFDEMQLNYLSQLYSSRYSSGHTFNTFVVPPKKLLGYLQQRFIDANGKLVQAKLSSLQDPQIRDYDVIINCTGIGARWLVPDDKVVPIRGQVIKVKAPWINETVIDDSAGNYVIPNTDECTLGGTHQHDFSTEVNQTDADFIIKGCQKLMPSLKDAEVLRHWAGLRPGRETIRLEQEEKDGKLYIHNYGHGGSGLTLSWGCGNEVLQILESHLNKKQLHKVSKL